MLVLFLNATAQFGFILLDCRNGKIPNRVIQVLGLVYSEISISVVHWDPHN